MTIIPTPEQLLRVLPAPPPSATGKNKAPQQQQQQQQQRATLSLKGKKIGGFPAVPVGSQLASRFSVLTHVDLSDNALTSLASVVAVCTSLRHLNVSKNNISDLAPLQAVSSTLGVLDISHQHDGCLVSLASLFLRVVTSDETQSSSKAVKQNKNKKQKQQQQLVTFPKLKALMANDNDISGSVFPAASVVPALETLILSRNPHLATPATTPADLSAACWSDNLPSSLRKLSVSSCGITDESLRLELPLVTELRLSHNNITCIPLRTVRLRSLKMLDISHNERFGRSTSTFETVAHFPFLNQLSFSQTAFAKARPVALDKMFRLSGSSGSSSKSKDKNMPDDDDENEEEYDGIDFSTKSGQLLLFFKSCFEFIRIVNGRPLPQVSDEDAPQDMLNRLKRRVTGRLKARQGGGGSNDDDDDGDGAAVGHFSDDDDALSSDSEADVDDAAGDLDEEDDEAAENMIGHRRNSSSSGGGGGVGGGGTRRQRAMDDDAADDAVDADEFLKRSGISSTSGAAHGGGASSKVVGSVKQRATEETRAAATSAAMRLKMAAAATRGNVGGW